MAFRDFFPTQKWRKEAEFCFFKQPPHLYPLTFVTILKTAEKQMLGAGEALCPCHPLGWTRRARSAKQSPGAILLLFLSAHPAAGSVFKHFSSQLFLASIDSKTTKRTIGFFQGRNYWAQFDQLENLTNELIYLVTLTWKQGIGGTFTSGFSWFSNPRWTIYKHNFSN